VWNKLRKAVQNSCKREEWQSLWVDHKSILQTLVDQTIHMADEFNGRSPVTETLSLEKILHLTKSKSLGGGLQSLWDRLLARTRLLLRQSNSSFNAQENSNILWAYGKADGIIRVDGGLLDSLAKTALIGNADFNPQKSCKHGMVIRNTEARSTIIA
jgi:hypothetical protein